MINKFILVGQLQYDPEMKVTAQGLAVTAITIKTVEHYGSDSKEILHKCSFFGQVAEDISQHYAKGDFIAVEGKVSSNKWNNPKTGEEQLSTQLIGQKIERLEVNIKPIKPAEQEEYNSHFITEASEMDNTPF